MQRAVDEVCRFQEAECLQRVVRRVGQEDRFLPPSELEELFPRWVISSFGSSISTASPGSSTGDHLTDTREAVTALDLHARVRLTTADTTGRTALEPEYFEIEKLSRMCSKEYWVEVSSRQGSEDSAGSKAVTRRRVDQAELVLDPPLPLYWDPLLPCDELEGPHGSSRCVFLAMLKAANRKAGTHTSAPHDLVAAEKTTELAQAARLHRRQLHHRLLLEQQLYPPGSVTGALQGDVREKDTLTLYWTGPGSASSSSSPPPQLLLRVVEKLALLWDAHRSPPDEDSGAKRAVADLVMQSLSSSVAMPRTDAGHPFFLDLFTMLLRYQALFGSKGYNQGPQAAVPPAVMEEIHRQFETEVEAFASPLNVYAVHSRFCSLFGDVDFPFGSLGSFFDVSWTEGHVEVNPPFDALVLRNMSAHLLSALTASDRIHQPSSLLFVVVLPSHDLDPGEGAEKPAPAAPGEEAVGQKRPRAPPGPSAERTLRESSFCLAHTVCPAEDAVYIDGHQHLLRVPLFRIQTPTRLIVLGNRTARLAYPDARKRLALVKQQWAQWTAATHHPVVD